MMDLLCGRRAFIPRFLTAAFGFSALANFAGVAVAEAPRVIFDLPYSVACRDVTPPEFAVAHPADKLVEVKLGISSLLKAGREKDLQQYFIRIDSPQRTMQVADFLPKSAHEALQGNTLVQKSDETTFSLGINFSGHYEGLTANVSGPGIAVKNGTCIKYELLPPLETVTASGTMLRGSGVYFKLKSSQRNLLEGERDFALILRVPRAWRADYLHVRCEAEGVVHGLVSSLDEKHLCGQRDFLVSLYLEGDEDARRTADNLSRTEAHLRSVVHVKGSEIAKRSQSSFAAQLGLVTSSGSAAVPADWQAQLLYGHPASAVIPKKLPREVVQAAQEVQAAQRGVARLSGWGSEEYGDMTLTSK